MVIAPTWIDAEQACEWQSGSPSRHDPTSRWFVWLDQSCKAFVVMSGNASLSSFGGEDAAYTAEEIASAIERWATPTSGLDATSEFLEALKRNVQRVKAKGAQLEIIRAKYLLDAMRARVAIAQVEDASPFPEYGKYELADDADTEILASSEVADDDPA